MPTRRTTDERTDSGAIIMWGAPRTHGMVMVLYPCCNKILARDAGTIGRLRSTEPIMCRTCWMKARGLVAPSTDKCPVCGEARAPFRYTRYGKVYHGLAKYCVMCSKPEQRAIRQQRALVTVCPLCGFEPLIREQLQAHHKDGNRRNNAPSNITHVCANCHVLLNHVQRCQGNGNHIDPAIDIGRLASYLVP